ncbi:hypothetical protein [Pseudoxanthomonas kaohsiungensis]|uniref:Uncharacterized protein n=1 Tax=Pseudoxanthomonas kaohsiungensis TaxID=283923 RepID=A0ABW3LZ38_9GAMM|nr:hypothetical protein [Pseudoxanthomonas kaohsiungensis]KAF1702923.1 hypothetical protein CSC66_09110 [Pseudoxanthomonas kaohsiungensis]
MAQNTVLAPPTAEQLVQQLVAWNKNPNGDGAGSTNPAGPEYAIVQGVDLDEMVERLHAASIMGRGLFRAAAVRVTAAGEYALLAPRRGRGKSKEQAMPLPAELAGIQVCDCEDFRALAP